MRPPNWFEWLTVLAIILGPVFALFAQRVLDRIREKRERRVQIYLTLMRTRAVPLAPDHINALNSINVVFDGWRDKTICAAWASILAHVVTDANQPDWQDKYNDLKVDLLREMGQRVGYNFSTDYLKRHFYYPKLYGQMETGALLLRAALTKALTSDGLKVQIVQPAEPSRTGANARNNSDQRAEAP